MTIGQKRIANIEIQDYVIRYSEVKSKKPFIVTQCDEVLLPIGAIENGVIVDEELFAKSLRECIKKWKLKGKKARIIVPDSHVIIRTVEIPAQVEEEELSGHVYFELGHSIHLPFEDPVVDTVLLGEDEIHKHVLLVASSSEIVNQYVELFKREKIAVIAADVSSLCQYRLFYNQQLTNENDIYMLAQVDVNSVTMSIFEKHVPIFMQQMAIPYEEGAWKKETIVQVGALTKEAFQKEKVARAFQDIFTEIERIFRFYQYSLNSGDKMVSKILLTGDHPYLDNIEIGITESLNLPIETIKASHIHASKEISIGPSFFNVIGLAMKEGL